MRKNAVEELGNATLEFARIVGFIEQYAIDPTDFLNYLLAYRQLNCTLETDEPREALEPDELIGVAELAVLLGTSRQRASQIGNNKKNNFPEPLSRLASGPVWLRAAVVLWIFHNRS